MSWLLSKVLPAAASRSAVLLRTCLYLLVLKDFGPWKRKPQDWSKVVDDLSVAGKQGSIDCCFPPVVLPAGRFHHAGYLIPLRVNRVRP